MSKLIFVVDDEPDILELVSLNLKKAGFLVKEFLEADSFLRAIKNQNPDLIILDLNQKGNLLKESLSGEVTFHILKFMIIALSYC